MTDIVERLRHWSHGLTYDPAVGLMHDAAAEIERLRNERRWIPVAERLPKDGEPVLWHYPEDTFCESVVGKRDGDSIDWGSDLNMDIARSVTHWMTLPEPIGLREPAEDTPTTHATQTQGSVQERCTLTAEEREAVTNHDAVPDARARDADRHRTDKAASRPGDGTGNTPSEAEIDALEFVVDEGRTASVVDYGILRSWLIRLRPEWESQSYEESDVNTNTNRDTTHDECSVCGEGTETVGERLVQRVLITQAMLDDNEMLRAEIARLRLSSAEREAVKWCRDNIIPMSSSASAFAFIYTATLRNLLERLT